MATTGATINYAQLGGDEPIDVKGIEAADRNGFVRKVYGILSAQLLLTMLVAMPFQHMDSAALVRALPGVTAASVGVLVVTLGVMCCCQEKMKQFPINYIVLAVITVLMGVQVGWISALYTLPSVLSAVGMTSAIFFGMTAYAFTTKTDFTGAGPYLMAAMMGLMCFALVLTVLQWCGVSVVMAQMLYGLCGVLLFTFYIVFDTQLMLGGSHSVSFGVDDYAFAALNLYLDIINLFLYILELFGDRK